MPPRPRTLLTMAKQVEDDLRTMLIQARKLRKYLEQIETRVQRP